MKLTVTVFYVLVVLMATRFCGPRGIMLVGAGCVGLTVLAYSLSGLGGVEARGIRLPMNVVVIALSTFLVIEQKRAMEAMRQSEEQWREVFEHNPVVYFMVSPTGTVLSVNGFGAAQLGYAAAELVGQSVLSAFLRRTENLSQLN
jgi:PAS domain-containing protein